jgi:hypothetical protein
VRGLSTVAAFAVLLTALAVVMFSVFYFYGVLRNEAQRGVSAVQSAVVRDTPVRLMYDGSRCLLEGGPYMFYILTRNGVAVYDGPSGACPGAPGLYRYVGVARSGDLGYAYVYVGPSVAGAEADKLVVFLSELSPFSFRLYLELYNNSSGWAPYSSVRVGLSYDRSLLSCNFRSGGDTITLGSTVVSPAGLASFDLGDVTCTPVTTFSQTTIGARVEQTYAAYTWRTDIPAVVYVINSTAVRGGGRGGGGGGGVCRFEPSSGERFGSPDGSANSGFNELNGWAAAWGPDGNGGVKIALMPGITPPDSTSTGSSYTVQLEDVEIGALTVSGGSAVVSVEGAMPGFMDVVRIGVDGTTIYYNRPVAAATLGPGTYAVHATLRVKPSPDVFGLSGTLRITCNGTSVASITLKVPRPEEWGLRGDVYTASGSPPPLPIGGSGYTYKGSWSVGGIYFWLSSQRPDSIRAASIYTPYFSSAGRDDTAPKWAAYWINPAGTAWNNYAIKFTGTLHVPWDRVRVGVWHGDAAYVKLCGIDTGTSWWVMTAPRWSWTSGTCTPGNNPVEVGYYEGSGEAVLVLVIGPGGADSEGNIHGPAYIPTIDGAWYCDMFWWKHPQWGGTCNGAWNFVPASQEGVPYFIASGYAPGPSDGGGAPRP